MMPTAQLIVLTFGLFALALAASIIFDGFKDRTLARSSMIGVFQLIAITLVSPTASILSASVLSRFNLGLFRLPTNWLWLIPGFLLYRLASDLLVYAMHRAQHKIPALWAMHSLHHAETRVTIMTAYVNFWGEIVMESAFVYPLVFLIFKVPAIYLFIGFWVSAFHPLFVHAATNMRFNGPLGYLLVSPDFHRIHHSSDPAHFNSNFAGTFSFWDWAFGTLVMPPQGGRIATGLSPEETPKAAISTLWWPLRKWL